MPVISDLSITSATYSASALTITVTGIAFAENSYPVSNIEYRLGSTGTWTSVTSISSWSDTVVIGVVPALSPGTYDIRVTNSDNEQTTYTGGFTIPMLVGISRLWVGVGVGV